MQTHRLSGVMLDSLSISLRRHMEAFHVPSE